MALDYFNPSVEVCLVHPFQMISWIYEGDFDAAVFTFCVEFKIYLLQDVHLTIS